MRLSKYISLVFSIVTMACSSVGDNKVASFESGFCENELSLLVTSADSTHRNLDLFQFGLSYEDYLHRLVDSEYDSFKVNIIFQADSLTSFPITILFEYLSDAGLIINQEDNCNVLINSENLIMVNEIICSSDSVKYIVKDFYQKAELSDTGTENEINLYLSFIWDQNAEQQLIDDTFIEILKGYFIVADSISRIQFGNLICELDKQQLDVLKSRIPFQLIVKSADFKNDITMPNTR